MGWPCAHSIPTLALTGAAWTFFLHKNWVHRIHDVESDSTDWETKLWSPRNSGASKPADSPDPGGDCGGNIVVLLPEIAWGVDFNHIPTAF